MCIPTIECLACLFPFQGHNIKLGGSWERTKLASSLKMGWACIEVKPHEVNLNQLTGNVPNTQKVMLQPFESRVVSRTMRGPIRSARISKRVNVLTEMTPTHINEESWFAYTYVSCGSSWAQVIKN